MAHAAFHLHCHFDRSAAESLSANTEILRLRLRMTGEAERKISGVLTTQKSGESFFQIHRFLCGFL